MDVLHLWISGGEEEERIFCPFHTGWSQIKHSNYLTLKIPDKSNFSKKIELNKTFF